MSQKTAPITALTPISEAVDPTQFVPMGPSPAFQELALLIVDENKYSFTAHGRIARKIERQISQCLQEEKGCYLLFHGVQSNLNMIQQIDDAFQALGIHRAVRCTHEGLLESLVIRLMLGAAY